MQLAPGQIVADKYRIEQLLDEGGMGSVYVAENLVLQKKVALKVLSGRQSSDSVERFMREGIAASRVKHPAIVQVFDAGMHEGRPWMAMELLSGKSLGHRLRDGRPTTTEAVDIVCSVLSALVAVHGQGIVHRDLKPTNIFLEHTPEGVQPKLLDFGIAKQALGENRLTATGAVLGTAGYLAPEQALDSSSVDARTDVYAMGIVLYESLSGTVPFAAKSVAELITKLLNERPRDLRSTAPQVPAELAAIVHRCLERDPDARYQSARELLATLRPFSGRPDASSHPTSLPPAALAPTLASSPALGAAAVATTPLPQSGGFVPGTRADSGPVVSPTPTPSRSGTDGTMKIIMWSIGLFLLVGVLIVGAVIAAGVAGVMVASREIGEGAGSGGSLFGEHLQWNSSGRPLFADVTGDQVPDVFGWVTILSLTGDMPQHIAAFDGSSGRRIWMSERLTDIGGQINSRAAIVEGILIVIDDRGTAQGFDAADGAARWSFNLGERADAICPGTAGLATAVTTDGRHHQIALGDGAFAPTTVACAPRIDSYVWTNFFETHVTGGTEMEEDASVPAMEVSQTFAAAENQLAVGRRAEGTQVPMVAWLRGSEVLWSQEVPGMDRLNAAEYAPNAAGLDHGQLYATFKRNDSLENLVGFELATGRRLFEVEIPDSRGQVRSVSGSGSLVYVSHWSYLDAFDRQTGERRYRIGRWQ